MYQAGLHRILGLQPRGTDFAIDPCIAASWPSYRIIWRYRSSRYEIHVVNPSRRCRGVARAELDGEPVNSSAIPLIDDGQVHRLEVTLGDRETSPDGTQRSDATSVGTLA
jgi:cyclic beta-1,2-glucan synthetase